MKVSQCSPLVSVPVSLWMSHKQSMDHTLSSAALDHELSFFFSIIDAVPEKSASPFCDHESLLWLRLGYAGQGVFANCLRL